MGGTSDIQTIAETAAEIDASAMEAAQAYYANYVKYGIGKYPKRDLRTGLNWPKFVQIARICLSHKIPVSKFVDAAFSRALERHAIVTVGDLCLKDPESVLRSSDSIQSSESPDSVWTVMSGRLVDAVFSAGSGASRTSVLDNPVYGFPAWFRVFATKIPVPELLLHWGDLAFEELSECPRLSEFLSEKRPSTFSLLKSVIEKI